ncbi:hypothetical protein XBKB1_1210003 [Xenorhabdus bovienii str. kraussei Becker Underwood]|uniref:Uncharacterized protein n=1 Tax=Xenorhabdus bovienii str. kraussei Becker Underwood TaxID=1398204 RepID=A0A077PPN7_XENBV|nr:hypothetical protein XBKB1_1210003 [Xenorhabdus bovienii str. kraussei Becker Underwood]
MLLQATQGDSFTTSDYTADSNQWQ